MKRLIKAFDANELRVKIFGVEVEAKGIAAIIAGSVIVLTYLLLTT